MSIKMFIGCAPNNEDLESQAVCEFSIRKHTKREVEITWLQMSNDPASPLYGWDTSFWTTPFSSYRWMIPELCGFSSQAIYSDPDVIYLADIGELWDQPFAAGKIVIAKGGQRYCVSKWDCAAARHHMPPIATLKREAGKHRQMMAYFASHPEIVQPFAGGDWNALDLEPFDLADPRIKALHYTGIPTQLQLKHALPRLAREGGRHWYSGPARAHPRRDLQKLFDRLLAEATANGYGIDRYRVEPFGQYDIRAGR